MTIFLRTFITSMSERKRVAYLQGKLNMASSSKASPEIHNENYDLEESFMEPVNQSPLPS